MKTKTIDNELPSVLVKLPTIYQGHTDNLKFEDDTTRLWVSRVDGSVTVEKLQCGRWVTVTHLST